MPLMCCGADLLGAPSRKQVVVVGDKASEEFDKMLAAAHSSYNPNKTVKVANSGLICFFFFNFFARDDFCVRLDEDP